MEGGFPASPHGTNFNFNEVNRDEWSVYLHDPSRDVRIQIDLHTRKIYYSDAHSPRRELYSIQSSSAKASGWSVTQANFGFGKTRLGTFRQTGDRKWRETSASPDGNNFNFNEVNRDEWSVYLHDPCAMCVSRLICTPERSITVMPTLPGESSIKS